MKANEIQNLFNGFVPIAIDYSGIAAKAKDLVDEMTYVKLSKISINRNVDVIQEHIDNENAVRNMLHDRGICLNILP